MQVKVELLACTEGITTCKTDLCFRTISTACTPLTVGFDIEIIRFVESAVQSQVKSVGTWTRRKLEVGA